MQIGQLELLKQTMEYSFVKVLDLGTGDGSAAQFFSQHDKKVFATSFVTLHTDALPESIFLTMGVDATKMPFADGSFDAVWCAHVLEHCSNVGLALAEIRRILAPGGILFLSVPEFSPNVVAGHVSPGWNLGILMYVLILSGFNVREGAFINYLGHVTAFVKRGDFPSIQLTSDLGEIEALVDYFPVSACVSHGFNGNINNINWEWGQCVSASAIPAQRRWILKKKIARFLPVIFIDYWRRRRIARSAEKMRQTLQIPTSPDTQKS